MLFVVTFERGRETKRTKTDTTSFAKQMVGEFTETKKVRP
jgi:hypothetical protein